MHIVYLTHEYPKIGLNSGGIGSVVQFLGRQLVSRGISVSIIGMNNKYIDENDNDQGVKVYRLSKSKWKFARFFDIKTRINAKIQEIDNISTIDIIEGSELAFAFFNKKTSYKKIIRLHGGHHFFAIELNKKPAYWRSFQEKQSFRKADGYVAVSNYVGSQTQQYLNLNFKYTTIYNSVDTEKFKQSDVSKVKQNSLLFVGSVCEKKGVRQLVQAMPIILKQVPDATLNIVGRDWKFPDGSSYTSFLKTFIPKDIEHSINIVGPVPHTEVANFIAETDICLYPSHMEAMPIAWLEGLSMAKKVIASDIGPGREAIKNNVTGVLINPYSPQDIAEKVVMVLKDKKYENMGIEARKEMLTKFNVEKIISENISFYESQIK